MTDVHKGEIFPPIEVGIVLNLNLRRKTLLIRLKIKPLFCLGKILIYILDRHFGYVNTNGTSQKLLNVKFILYFYGSN